MDNKQSLANQLGWSITTKDHLNELSGEIRYISKSYQNSVEWLKENQYLKELQPQIEQMQQEFQTATDDLVRHIESEHLAYIDTQSRNIQLILNDILAEQKRGE